MKQDNPNGKGGSGNQPQPRREFDLNHVDLHSDVTVDRFIEQDQKKASLKMERKRSRTRTKELFFSAFLNMVLAGGFGYLMWERQENTSLHTKQISSIQQQFKAQEEKLQQAELTIQSLSGNNQKLKSKEESLSVKQKNLSSAVVKEREQATKYKNEISNLKKSKAKLEKDLKSQKKKVANLKSNSAKKEKEFKGRISSLETDLLDRKKEYQTQVLEAEEKLGGLVSERNQLAQTLNRYKNQISEEAKAGKAAMVEQGKLASENRVLLGKVKKLEREQKQFRLQIKDLKEVTTGELVPFSTEITIPVPHFKEPFPKSLKWPRGVDALVVHMQINESGGVNEIYYPQGQFVDTAFKSLLNPVLFKWKFSPPKFGALSVKTWIPVVIRKP